MGLRIYGYMAICMRGSMDLRIFVYKDLCVYAESRKSHGCEPEEGSLNFCQF